MINSGVAITKPTPAYDILSWVQKHIIEEPKRLRMGMWFYQYDIENKRSFDPEKIPRCGTIACEAGWIGLRCGVRVMHSRPVIMGVPFDWEFMSEVIAGFNTSAAEELRQSFINDYYTPDGTEEQAEAVTAFLTQFKSKWSRQLKRRIILPGGRVRK